MRDTVAMVDNYKIFVYNAARDNNLATLKVSAIEKYRYLIFFLSVWLYLAILLMWFGLGNSCRYIFSSVSSASSAVRCKISIQCIGWLTLDQSSKRLSARAPQKSQMHKPEYCLIMPYLLCRYKGPPTAATHRTLCTKRMHCIWFDFPSCDRDKAAVEVQALNASN